MALRASSYKDDLDAEKVRASGSWLLCQIVPDACAEPCLSERVWYNGEVFVDPIVAIYGWRMTSIEARDDDSF